MRTVDGVTRTPHFEDVLGPLAAVIVREVAARGEASVADIVEGLRRTQGRDYAYTTIRAHREALHGPAVSVGDRDDGRVRLVAVIGPARGQLASEPLVRHMQPLGDLAGTRPG